MHQITTHQAAEPYYLKATKAIYDEMRVPFGSTPIQVLTLAEGYALLSGTECAAADELEVLLLSLIRYRKVVIIENVGSHTVRLIQQFCTRCARMLVFEVEDLEPRVFNPNGTCDRANGSERILALVPRGFVRRRVMQQRKQRELDRFCGEDALPTQHVHVVGIGTDLASVTPQVADRLVTAPSIVTFDFIYDIIRHLPLAGKLEILDYDWDDYATNIERVNRVLSRLHVHGVYDTTVVVEGNPEVYDLLSYLSPIGRDYCFDAITPAIVLCCEWVEEHYGVAVRFPDYVLISGYNLRHGVTVQQLAGELDTYLETEITVLVIEMYSGALPLVFERVQQSPSPKAVLLMMNMFTPEQEVYVLSHEQLLSRDCAQWAEHTKGKFTSVAIVDQRRLSATPGAYDRLLRECAPTADSAR